MKFKLKTLIAAVAGAALISSASAAKISIVSGAVGDDLKTLRGFLDTFEKKTGHTVKITGMPKSTTDQFGQYKLWLSSKSSDIDIYKSDVIWAPQIAKHLVDLTPYTKDIVKNFFPSIIESQTVNGKLVGMPWYTDAPGLYYRKDLLEKYKQPIPKTWEEMAKSAKIIQEGERKAGNKKFYGFVFQASAYEGLTCDALEWVKSAGGGQIVEADGSISINNEKAKAAITMVKSWIGDISPKGVLAYTEEESRGIWQLGNAAFMRNWPYAYSLGQGEKSAIANKFGLVPLPSGGEGSAATLGGWNWVISKYSKNQEASIELVKFLVSPEVQKQQAIKSSKLPTLMALYDDAEVKEKAPVVASWKNIFLNAVPRPSAPTMKSYNEVSKEFWTAVHNTLAGEGTVDKNFKKLDAKLKRLKGSGWK